MQNPIGYQNDNMQPCLENLGQQKQYNFRNIPFTHTLQYYIQDCSNSTSL